MIRAVVVGDLGNVLRRDILVAGVRHLERRGQVGPQLEPVHLAAIIAVRHLLVDDAAAGRHPLHVAGADAALVAEAVAVVHVAGQHVRDRLDAAVRMPRKARDVIGRPVAAEIVEQEERVDLVRVAEAEGPAKAHARALHGELGPGETLHGTDGHMASGGSHAYC
jgi:hypothetical protein